MAEIPQIDEILKTGRARERRLQIGLGLVLVVGGLAFALGMQSLTEGGLRAPTFGAIGVGLALLGHGLFKRA